MLKISVIVPVYKVEPYIVRCIDSLLNQDFDAYQIIAVDDGSPDGCGVILDRYQANHPERMAVIHKTNGGLSDARNAGLNVARGNYIAFVDSDDFVTRDYLSNFWHAVQEFEADLVIGAFSYDYSSGRSRQSTHHDLPVDSPMSLASRRDLICKTPTFAWNKLYHRKFFFDLGFRFPKGTLFEDLSLVPRVILNADRVVLRSSPTYHYILRSDSIMGSGRGAEQVIGVLQGVRDYYRQQGRFEAFRDELEYIHIAHLLIGRYVFGWPAKDYLYAAARIVSEEFPGWINNRYLGELHPPEVHHALKALVRWGPGPARMFKLGKYYLEKLKSP